MIVLRAEINPDQEDPIIEALGAIDFYNVVVQSEPGAEPELTCYCDDDTQEAAVRKVLSPFTLSWESTSTTRKALIESSESYQASNDPIQLCEGIWIVDSSTQSTTTAELLSAHPGAKVITLNTQFAFGDGAHASTRLGAQCLLDLDCDGKQVIDLGCGTGVLGLMAHANGARKLMCTDVDQDSVIATQQACQLNGVNDAEVIQSDLLTNVPPTWQGQGDIIIGNLYAPLLVEMLSDPKWPGLLADECDMIFSGIHHDKRDAVLAAISTRGYEVLDDKQDREWHALHLRKA